MPEVTPPHRFRFSLRTLFVLVTIVCVWLGYASNWIRQREALRRLAYSHDEFRFQVIDGWVDLGLPLIKARAPSGLWLLGETGVATMRVRHADFERAKQFFPEAEIWDHDADYDG